MREFKEGDIIIMKKNCSRCYEGQEYELGLDEEEILCAITRDGETGCSCQEYWILKEPNEQIIKLKTLLLRG